MPHIAVDPKQLQREISGEEKHKVHQTETHDLLQIGTLEHQQMGHLT